MTEQDSDTFQKIGKLWHYRQIITSIVWNNLIYNYAAQAIRDTPLAGAFCEINIIYWSLYFFFFVYMDFGSLLGQCLHSHNLCLFKLPVQF